MSRSVPLLEKGVHSKSSRVLKHILVVIDPKVTNAQQLAIGIVSEAHQLMLDPDRDGVGQITEALQTHQSITTLHLIGYGEPGKILLGNSELSWATLEKQAWELQSWFASHHNCSILLYGCNVAAGDVGIEFLNHLHQLCGASIAASSQLIGRGQWHLDIQRGTPNTTPAFTPKTLDQYEGMLGSTQF